MGGLWGLAVQIVPTVSVESEFTRIHYTHRLPDHNWLVTHITQGIVTGSIIAYPFSEETTDFRGLVYTDILKTDYTLNT